MKKLLTMICLAAAFGSFAGCSSQEAKQPPATVEEVKPAPVAPPAATASPAPEQQPIVANPLKDPNSILSKRSVYYDFDSSQVNEEYKPLVTAHAQYLVANRDARITIQGNCDERGSREYNLALGQRRADGVKQMMLLLGAADKQIDTISFGEEKPRAPGHDESSWKQNRRSDIVYAGE
ncbi:MAG TPA: peptidoglycan-associated lipoprotein Pal [Burkholderiales bacterium]|nr:peptidoglycan-associated lipoprotein Pal [Burkholderiales bacterium]